VKVRTGVILASFSALGAFLCAPLELRAQAGAESVVTSTPAMQAKPPAVPGPGNGQAPAVPAPQPIMQPVGPTNQDSSNDLSVTVGKSVVLDLARPIKQIVVGLGDYAEASAVSPTQVLVNGRQPGETTLIIWDVAGARQFFNVTVRPSTFATHDQLDAVRRQLRIELPGQDVNVTAEAGNVYVRGTVADLTSSNRAVMIAGTAGKVVNLLNVRVPEADRQILLKVRFASVDRQKEKQLGINLFTTGLGNTWLGGTTGQFSPPSFTMASTGSSPGSTVNTGSTSLSSDLQLFAFYPGLNIGATIEDLETRGLVESLAEPNILAENGKQASFLAGGEYPFPMVQGAGVGGSGAVTIQFKEYGIRLTFIPTITPRGTIRLQVAPEVSALDFADAVTIAGFVEPAITVRRVKTEVELADRQSFAIGGMLDNTENETFEKIPFLGDIPILGKLFQSMQRTKNNSELIVIVTPEIVTPVPAGTEIAVPKMPQSFLPPNSNTPMSTPDAAAAEGPAAPASMPVEQLIESMKPGPALSDSGSGGGGGGGMAPSGGMSPQ
jgi:pilus assembly protein CpaC